ncbi:FAD-binding oxidoreductase [Streptomycetaceae bacterium NBC_01309]
MNGPSGTPELAGLRGLVGGCVVDVVVIGGGIEGMAVAWALTQRGVRDVLVLERDTVGSGGTGKSSGVVRCHYGVPSLAAMAWQSLQLFEQAEEVWGQDIGFRQSGYLVGVGPENVRALEANVAAQRALGIDTRLVDHDAAGAMWPTAELKDFASFAYEARGGHGDAYLTCHALALAAKRAGARIRQHSPVASLLTSGDRVTGVRLAEGSAIAAATVVVAAGPWSPALVAPVGVDLPVRAMREPLLLVAPGAPVADSPVLSDLVSLQYVRSEGPNLLVGNSDLSAPDWADPDRYTNLATTAETERAALRFAARFPGLPDAGFASSYAGCYDATPDFNPVIGPAGPEGLFVAAGFSGHGFKIAPAVGTLVADLLCEGASSHPDIRGTDFRLERFAEGRPLASRHPYVGAGEMR